MHKLRDAMLLMVLDGGIFTLPLYSKEYTLYLIQLSCLRRIFLF